MNNRTLLFTVCVIMTSLMSCSDNSAKQEKIIPQNKTSSIPDNQEVDTTHVHTGFYFLTDEEMDGIKMKKEGSNEFYSLAKIPFASVINIKQTELQTTKLEDGDYTEICLTFDNKGTKDLEEGTGNILHPKIAIVIAGKLLYVVDNNAKIKTGVMCIGLVGYSKDEMARIKTSIDHKN
jgi:hypothetical protein